MTNFKTQQEIEKEFDEKFTPDWWNSFKKGIDAIKSFIFRICQKEEYEKIKRFERRVEYRKWLKKIKEQPNFGYQFRGNGYGFWTLEEAIKKAPDKLTYIYWRQNGRLMPLGTKEQLEYNQTIYYLPKETV